MRLIDPSGLCWYKPWTWGPDGGLAGWLGSRTGVGDDGTVTAPVGLGPGDSVSMGPSNVWGNTGPKPMPDGPVNDVDDQCDLGSGSSSDNGSSGDSSDGLHFEQTVTAPEPDYSAQIDQTLASAGYTGESEQDIQDLVRPGGGAVLGADGQPVAYASEKWGVGIYAKGTVGADFSPSGVGYGVQGQVGDLTFGVNLGEKTNGESNTSVSIQGPAQQGVQVGPNSVTVSNGPAQIEFPTNANDLPNVSLTQPALTVPPGTLAPLYQPSSTTLSLPPLQFNYTSDPGVLTPNNVNFQLKPTPFMLPYPMTQKSSN